MKFSRDYTRTGGVGDPETTDLDRRSQDNVKRGEVAETDYEKSPPVYRIGIGNKSDEDDYILTDWLPANGGRAKGDTEAHLLEVGEKVVLLSEGGDLSTATVIPAGTFTGEGDDQKSPVNKAGVWRKKFKNGGEITYDRNSGAMLLDATSGGTLTLKGGGCEIELKGGVVTVKAGSFKGLKT
jgi:phage baseplate assembly protein V